MSLYLENCMIKIGPKVSFTSEVKIPFFEAPFCCHRRGVHCGRMMKMRWWKLVLLINDVSQERLTGTKLDYGVVFLD